MRTLMTAASALLVLGLALGTAHTQERTQEQRQPSDKKKNFGKKGPGFPGFGRPQPGLILSPGLQQTLKLTDDQKKQVEDLQKDVDSRLAKILTEEQRSQLKTLRAGASRGPGFGGPDGPGFQKKRFGGPAKKDNPPQ